jgi:uncharacterized protein YjbJ (UPF0337 family)
MEDFQEHERGREPMKPGIQDEVEGKLHNLKGKVKEKVGELTNDPDLEADGEAEEVAGKVQEKVGQVKKVLGK